MIRDGAALFAYCLDILLYGILTVQTYIYYLAFPKDRWQVKLIVYFVYIVGIMQTAFALRDFYTLFCTSSGDLLWNINPRIFGFMWFTIPVSDALVAVIAQLFYAYRIWTISRKKVITVVVSASATTQFVCGIITAATDYKRIRVVSATNFVTYVVDILVWGSVGGLCDILIAIYMFYFLSKQLSRVPRRTQVPLTRIKRLLLETGILTAAMATSYTILSASVSTNFGIWFMIPGLSLSKLYSNSMLVLMNNRATITGGRNAPQSDLDVVSFHCSERPDATRENEGLVMS
ncbi:hypothetical protein P691DRAFT_737615 [Macrolepiota fuliginosa MF-IS2]|uniref:DUF6534 domain-containing protein n=1 Tax=Macrolepiota fuliginosa MF-IS2 TaxID=1400762 RepID=A0A9P6BZH4_9AGAR|nr:hypothetical protein P691DRAFT_737615 [Macrolepiota fuliginosa MF-IS2]